MFGGNVLKYDVLSGIIIIFIFLTKGRKEERENRNDYLLHIALALSLVPTCSVQM